MRTRQTFRGQMRGRCYGYVGDNAHLGKAAADKLRYDNRHYRQTSSYGLSRM